jgi:hypothetical protein
MHTRFAVLVVALAGAVAIGGCLESPSSGPNAPPGNESFTITVDGNSTHSVYVATHLYGSPVDSVTLEYANGSSRAFSVPDAQALTAGRAPVGLRSVDFPADDGGVYFEGPPPFSASANDIAPMRQVAFVVRVDGSDQVAAWGVAICEGHVDEVTLDVDGRNVSVGGLACSS